MPLSTEQNPKEIEGVTVHSFIKKNKTVLILIGIAVIVTVIYFVTKQKKSS